MSNPAPRARAGAAGVNETAERSLVALRTRFDALRGQSLALVDGLSAEDYAGPRSGGYNSSARDTFSGDKVKLTVGWHLSLAEPRCPTPEPRGGRRQGLHRHFLRSTKGDRIPRSISRAGHPSTPPESHSMKPFTLALALLAVAFAAPADAYLLQSSVNSNGSFRHHVSSTGVIADGAPTGSTGGSVGTGGSDSTAFATGISCCDTFAGTGSAYASANLLDGSLRASAMNAGFSDSRASAQLRDSVTFHVPGATPETLTPVVVELQLNGSINLFQSAGYLYNFIIQASSGPWGGGVGWTTQFYDSPTDPRKYVGWAVSGGAGEPFGWASWDLLAGTATSKHFRGVLMVPGDNKTFDIQTNFQLGCAMSTSCDFANSAHLRFELPAGVSFTSGSGLLLTAAVPEPASAALLLAGLGALSWVARRRRR
jgi:hypothetical protein